MGEPEKSRLPAARLSVRAARRRLTPKPSLIRQRGLDIHRYICSEWFASLSADGWPTGPGTGGSAYHILRRLVLMPDSFLVLRAFPLRPLVRLGWGAIFGPLVW